jgi:hypothetical protein
MHDTTWLLERAGERFEMPEPAMDRLVRRRDRRRRRQQLAAAALALTISVLGVGVALVALRTGRTATPASGPDGPTGGGGSLGSLVLPSLAIWAAIGALAVVLLVLGRLRERPAGPTPGETGPDGHGARTARIRETPPSPAGARGRGRREEAMATHVERYPERHTARNVWVTVGVLALLALAIGTGVLIGRATVEEAAPAPEPLGLASTEIVEAIDANIAALNAADEVALAATFAEDAILTDMLAGTETVGADEIAAVYLEGMAPGDWDLERASEVVQYGSGWAANAFTYYNGGSITVFLFDEDMKIAHQWVMGGPMGY